MSEPNPAQTVAFRRRARFLLRMGAAAELTLTPDGQYLGRAFSREPRAAAFTEASASAWLGVHLGEMQRTQQLAWKLSSYSDVWEFAETCAGVLARRGLYSASAIMLTLGLRAATRDRRGDAATRMGVGLADLHVELGEPEMAAQHARNALNTACALVQPGGEAAALRALGSALLAQGDIAKAGFHFTDARGIYQALGQPREVALLERDLGRRALADGKLHAAERHLSAAVGYFRKTAPEPYHEAQALVLLIRSYATGHQPRAAQVTANTLLRLAQSGRWTAEQAAAHEHLAYLTRRFHNDTLAARHRSRAQTINAWLEQERRAARKVLGSMSGAQPCGDNAATDPAPAPGRSR